MLSDVVAEGSVGHNKVGMEMPKYHATLVDNPVPVGEDALLHFGKQLEAALQGMHRLNYAHTDVKASLC